MDILEQGIIDATDPDKCDKQSVERTIRDLSIGITPLQSGDPRFSGVRCDGCGASQDLAEKNFLQCGNCRMVSYCRYVHVNTVILSLFHYTMSNSVVYTSYPLCNNSLNFKVRIARELTGKNHTKLYALS